jgi:two-component system, response regulator YesN
MARTPAKKGNKGMLKILIVDDETPIREWIEFCINKNPEGYAVVGLAANGEEAFKIFNATLPDIVFVDIKMPIMDGMELMKQIKFLNPATEVIVLTAHNDFEYARTAVKYGAMEYILKTEINETMIHDLLDKVNRKLSFSKTDSNLSDVIYLKREAFIRRMIFQAKNQYLISEKELQEHKINLKNNFLFAVALKYITKDQPNNNSNLIIPKHQNIQNTFGFVYDQNIFILLANVFAQPSIAEQIKTTFDFASRLQESNGCTIGLSDVHDGLKYIGTAVDEAVCRLKLEFYTGEGSINSMKTPMENNPELLKKLTTMTNSCKETIKQNGIEMAEQTMDAFLVFIEDNRINDIEAVQYACLQMVDLICTDLEFDQETGVDSFHTYKAEIERITSFQALQGYVKQKMNDAISGHRKKTNEYSHSISKAVAYINKYYMQSINLTNVATYVHLNPEYFCRLFKEETGNNFSNYLACVRLNKAVELLKQTDMKVHEIAGIVGYSNLSYFSTLFKKYYGVSPFDYRNKHTEVKITTI